MKLRSPSNRRLPPRLRRTVSPPHPTKNSTDSDSPDPDFAPSLTPSQPAVDPEFCNTERARAILGAMKCPRVKKLDALAKTPPALNVVQTPPRRSKKVHPPSCRQTPPRKSKKPALNPVIKPPTSKNSVVNPLPKSTVPPRKKTRTQFHQLEAPDQIQIPHLSPNHEMPTIEIHPPPMTAPPPVENPHADNPHPPTESHPPPMLAKVTELPPRANPHPIHRASHQIKKSYPSQIRRSPRCLSKTAGRSPAPEPPAFSNPLPTVPTLSNPSRALPTISNPISMPARLSSPTPVPANDPPAPEFEADNSMDTDHSSDHDEEDSLEELPSIRCRNSQNAQSADEGGEKRKVRGVVNGSNVAFYKHTRNKGLPIKVEFLPDGTGPADRKVCSLLVHEIGSVIKDKVPMLAPSFKELEEKDRQIVYEHLYGEAMSRVRTESERLNHRSGKVPFYMRAAELKFQGEKAHLVATYAKVYSHDPAGAALAAQMEERVHQALRDLNGSDESDEGIVVDEQQPLPIDNQIQIINEVLGQKRGTNVSGAGRAYKRPPLPRGGPRNSELKDQLQQQKDDMLEMKKAFEERIRTPEELVVRGGSANLPHYNASKGATSYGPVP